MVGKQPLFAPHHAHLTSFIIPKMIWGQSVVQSVTPEWQLFLFKPSIYLIFTRGETLIVYKII